MKANTISKVAMTVLSFVSIACSGAFAAAATETPKQFYLQYHLKCMVVSTPKALLPWRSKDSIARDQPMSDDEIESVYPMIKDMMPKKVTVLSEEIKGNRATLKVVGEAPKSPEQPPKKGAAAAAPKEQTVGIVLLVKEDGIWKMDHESWTSR